MGHFGHHPAMDHLGTLMVRTNIRNSKITKGQTEIVKSEDRQDNGQQNETKDKQNTQHDTENQSWSNTNPTKTRVISGLIWLSRKRGFVHVVVFNTQSWCYL